MRYESWMFRVKGEFLALFFSACLVLVLGIVLSVFNIYVALLAILVALILVHLQQAQFMGNAIRVYEDQYPEIYEIFAKFARQLGIKRGSLYIRQDPQLNASTIGINTCSVVLTSALVEQFTPEELQFVIGHELGHFKAGHTKLSSLVTPLGTDNIFSNLLFGFWQRKNELTADRCGLMLTKDINAAIESLIKLNIGATLYKRLDMRGYIRQMKSADRTSVRLGEILVDHPFANNRIKNLVLFWKESFKTHEM